MACFPREVMALAFAACLAAAAACGASISGQGRDVAFYVGERVRVQDNGASWRHGTVGQLMPLRVFRDGSENAYVFDEIQHTGEAPFYVGERVQVRDNGGSWRPGTVSQLTPLRVFRDGSENAYVFDEIQHTGEAPFYVGERVQVRDNGGSWRPGTVSQLTPLRVFRDGSENAYVFDEIQRLREAPAPFHVGERVQVRGTVSEAWKPGTVSEVKPLIVLCDGSDLGVEFGFEQVQHSGTSFAQPIVRGATLLIMCANLLVLSL